LARVHVPMLFLQGTRDALAEPELLATVVERLPGLATPHLMADADHSFHVPARSGKTDAQVLAEALDTLAEWARSTRGSARTENVPDLRARGLRHEMPGSGPIGVRIRIGRGRDCLSPSRSGLTRASVDAR
jgi:hypothetical protein